MGNGINILEGCTGRLCGYGIANGKAGCSSGGGSCTAAKLLEAAPSEFHDQCLIDATQAIRGILEGIPADRYGRKLSFLHTNMGSLLAWVGHGEAVPANAVTADHADATIAEALGLIGVDTGQAAQQAY
jgi:hypothetical protein